MAYSIELYFNHAFEEKIHRLWDVLRKNNVPSIMQKIGSRPHIALSILDDIAEEKIPDIIHYIGDHYPQFEIDFPAISMIPGKSQAVFLSPSQTERLTTIQGSLHEYLLKKGHTPREHYYPDQWLPHVTISKELSFKQTLETLKACEHCPVTGNATVIEAGIIEFRPRKQIETCRLNAAHPGFIPEPCG